MADGDRVGVEVALKAAGGVALVFIGHQVAGLAGELVAPLAQPIVDQLAAHRVRLADGVVGMLGLSAREAGMPEDTFGRRIGENEQRAALLAEAVEVAYATVDREKLRALAAVLADGVVDDARIELCRLFARALRQVEAPHIAVMRALVDPPRHPVGGSAALTTAELAERLPGVREALGGLLGPLTATGCVETSNASYYDQQHRPYVLTDFGRGLLAYVRAEGDVDDEG